MSKKIDKTLVKVFLILRRATNEVKVAPFCFAALYVLVLLSYLLFNDIVSSILDSLCYISPIVIVMELRMSKIFKMCIWHRIECILPFIPTLIGFIDQYVTSLDNVALWVNWAVIVFTFILSLINGYFVFVKKTDYDEICKQ